MTTRTLLTIIIAGLLVSCSSVSNKKNKSITSTVDFKTLDTTVVCAGYWISEDYLNNISKFKSPKKAQDGSEFLVIPDRTIKQTVIIYNFHEGGPLLNVLKHEDKYEIWEVRDDSLIKFSTIEIISPTKIKFGEKNFVKINSHETDRGFLILEEILFKGFYTNAKNENIEFKNNGEVVGLNNFHFFEPVIDYFGEGLNIDQIRIGKSKEENTSFGFKFNSDTLELYKLNCVTFDKESNSCNEVGFGQLAYKLWKKR